MTTHERKRLQPILRVVMETNVGGLGAVAAAMLDDSRRRAPAKAMRTRAQARAEKRAERREYMAGLRKDVLDRDGKLCVLCGTLATEVHHLLSGNGVRRTHEKLETLVSLCFGCHRQAHNGDRLALSLLEGWCEAKGYSAAAAALRRRIEKIEATRSLTMKEPT